MIVLGSCARARTPPKRADGSLPDMSTTFADTNYFSMLMEENFDVIKQE
jgi:hypothetical protein